MTDDYTDPGPEGLNPTTVTLDDGTVVHASDLSVVPGYDTLVFDALDGSHLLVSELGEGRMIIGVDDDGNGGLDRAFLTDGTSAWEVDPITGELGAQVDPSLVPMPSTGDPTAITPSWANPDEQVINVMGPFVDQPVDDGSHTAIIDIGIPSLLQPDDGSHTAIIDIGIPGVTPTDPGVTPAADPLDATSVFHSHAPTGNPIVDNAYAIQLIDERAVERLWDSTHTEPYPVDANGLPEAPDKVLYELAATTTDPNIQAQLFAKAAQIEQNRLLISGALE